MITTEALQPLQHFDRVVDYIRDNPTKAGLREGEFALFESEILAEGGTPSLPSRKETKPDERPIPAVAAPLFAFFVNFAVPSAFLLLLSWFSPKSSESLTKILHSTRRTLKRRSHGPQSLQVQNQIVRRQAL